MFAGRQQPGGHQDIPTSVGVAFLFASPHQPPVRAADFGLLTNGPSFTLTSQQRCHFPS